VFLFFRGEKNRVAYKLIAVTCFEALSEDSPDESWIFGFGGFANIPARIMLR